MKFLISFLLTLTSAYATSIYDFKLKSATKGEINFKEFKGKKIVVVNIATKCGFTGQLDDLQKLHTKYKASTVVVGIPTNDFGGQTPEGNQEVAKFCRLKYGVDFPITEKIKVLGDDRHALGKYLTKLKGSDIKWNFEKFVFDENGKYIDYFSSFTGPTSSKITKLLK